MHYSEFLKIIGEHGYGVFTLSMLSTSKISERAALVKFMQRNPEYFIEHKGSMGDLKICFLSAKGKTHFGFKYESTKSESWASLLDIALFNAYMFEVNSFAKVSNKPHFILELKNEKVSLISQRWGISKNFKEADKFLCTKNFKDRILIDPDYISQSAKELKIKNEKVVSIIQNSFTPLSLKHFR